MFDCFGSNQGQTEGDRSWRNLPLKKKSERFHSSEEAVSPTAKEDQGARLSAIDRFLPVWIFVAMGLGIALGRVYPASGRDARHGEGRGRLAAHRGRALLDDVPGAGESAVRQAWSPDSPRQDSRASLVFNWIIGPVLMFRLAWLFCPICPTTGRAHPHRPGALHRHGAHLEHARQGSDEWRPSSWRSTPSSRSCSTRCLGGCS